MEEINELMMKLEQTSKRSEEYLEFLRREQIEHDGHK